MRFPITLLAVLPLLVSIASCAPSTSQGGPCHGTIAIATDLPQSGPERAVGQSAQLGAQLAVEQAQAINLLYGCRIQLISNDDASTPARGVQNLNLDIANTEGHVVGVAGPMDDAVAAAEIPIAHGYSFAMVSPFAIDPSLGTIGPTTFFRVSPSATGEATALLQGLPKGWNKLLFLSDGTAIGTGLAQVLLQMAVGEGFSTGSEFSGQQSAQVMAARDSSLNAIFYAGSLRTAGLLHRALSDAGVKTPFWIGDSGIDPALTSQDSANLEGVTKAFLGLDPHHPSSQSFADSFKNRFGLDPSWYAANEFDATSILLYASRRVLDQDNGFLPSDMNAFRSALPTAIAAIQWDGATGQSSFDTGGLSHHVWVLLEQRTGGSWQWFQTVQVAA